MKILNLKYKIHKMVNYIFYLVIFIFGFLLGFSVEKINFNNLISNFLFIDNVYAEESDLVCTDSENLFDVTDVLVNGVTNEGAEISLGCTDHCLIVGGGSWKYVNYDITLEPGTYYLGAYDIYGGHDSVEVRILNEETLELDWLYALHCTSRNELILEKETTIQFRFYSSTTSSTSTQYKDVYVVKEICEEIEADEEVFVDIVDDNFYGFAQKIFGEVSEENQFIYDFITFGLISACFILFVSLLGFIIRKFFGG